ncbi:unnamed protein product [Parajaminaea phylloscopi]
MSLKGRPLAVEAIINPVSGARGAQALWRDVVRPRLTDVGVVVPHEHETRAQGDGIRIGREIRKRMAATGQVANIVVLGGDGTTHEVLHGLYGPEESDQSPTTPQVRPSPPSIRLIVVPSGTANALYAAMYPTKSEGSAADGTAWRLHSLQSFLNHAAAPAGTPTLYPVTITSTQTDTVESSPNHPQHMIAHLITSHALHAAILHDSEALRASHPGVERFKIAAAQNVTRWVDGILTLYAEDGGNVERFSPETKAFVPVASAQSRLAGPFLYMICTTVDRLEPQFVPAPFASPQVAGQAPSLARPLDALDVVIVRPARDPLVQTRIGGGANARADPAFWEAPESLPGRQAFAESRATPLTQAMYDQGKHVYLRYPDGSDAETPSSQLADDNHGPPMVEYFRCHGYDWQPSASSIRAALTCIDGTVLESRNTRVRVLDEASGKVHVFI